MMDFNRHYQKALELLPPDQREYFKDCLVGSMAVYLDEDHLVRCMARSLNFAQGFKPSLELVKQ